MQFATTPQQPEDARLIKVIRLVNATPNVRRAELARMVNLSTSRLAHLFKIETGTTLAGYRRKVRMEFAAELLKSTDERIKAIAFAAGYNHTSSFVRAFIGRFKESPMSYRHRVSGADLSSEQRN
jgi:AraC-like DNA-binding protein